MADLSVNFAGIKAPNPFWLASGPPTNTGYQVMKALKKQFPGHVFIASLMVQSREEWQQIVRDAEQAGVDGIELNFGCQHGTSERGMGSVVGQEPKLVEMITGWVMEVAKVPVLVKLTPNITNITEPARAAVRGGANSIALINTIHSITGVGLRAALNENFIISVDYGFAFDKQDGSSGLYIGIENVFLCCRVRSMLEFLYQPNN